MKATDKMVFYTLLWLVKLNTMVINYRATARLEKIGEFDNYEELDKFLLDNYKYNFKMWLKSEGMDENEKIKEHIDDFLNVFDMQIN